MLPKVSIIIPVYNSSTYLDRCIDSLLNQSLHGLEVIFVNDCSTDDSLNILERRRPDFAADKFLVKIINMPENRGSSAARNAGLAEVSAPYLGWVDSDDKIQPRMFEMLYHLMLNKETDLVLCDFDLVFRDSRKTISQQLNDGPEQYIVDLVSGRMQGMLWNKLFKASIFKENRIKFLEGSNLGEDRNVLLKYLFYCKSLCYLSESLYEYFQENTGSITRDPKVARVYEEINNTADIIDFFSKNNFKGLSLPEIQSYEFKSKRKLLNSTNLIDFKNWAIIFKNSNYLIWKSNLPLSHKILANAADLNIWFIIKSWIWIKKMKSGNIVSK